MLSRTSKLVRGEAAGRVPKLTLPLKYHSGGVYREELRVPLRLVQLKLVPLRLGREESEESENALPSYLLRNYSVFEK